MDFQTFKLELQKRCLDLGMIQRPAARYGEALNYALSQYPRALWRLDVDESLNTAEGVLVYDLSAVTGLDYANQVRRVWIDDSDGVPREVGRYEARDDGGKPYLALDEPPDGTYDITLEFWAPPAAMSQPTDTTTADDDWLLARAMLALAGETDWTINDPQQVVSRLEYWNARLLSRERQLLAQRRRTSRRARTTAWRQFVT